MWVLKSKAAPELKTPWHSAPSHPQGCSLGKMREPHSLDWPVINSEQVAYVFGLVCSRRPLREHSHRSLSLNLRDSAMECWDWEWVCMNSLGSIEVKGKQLSWLLDRQLPTPQFFWKKVMLSQHCWAEVELLLLKPLEQRLSILVTISP